MNNQIKTVQQNIRNQLKTSRNILIINQRLEQQHLINLFLLTNLKNFPLIKIHKLEMKLVRKTLKRLELKKI